MVFFSLNKEILSCCLFTSFCVGAASLQAAEATGRYSSLNDPKCKITDLKNSEGDFIKHCPAVANYRLTVSSGDSRENLAVVAPNGKEFSLKLQETISPALASLGEKIEWRFAPGARSPNALIARFEVFDVAGKPTSYLLVAKIIPDQICVTDKIAPGPKANEEARRAADQSASKPCLPTLPNS